MVAVAHALQNKATAKTVNNLFIFSPFFKPKRTKPNAWRPIRKPNAWRKPDAWRLFRYVALEL